MKNRLIMSIVLLAILLILSGCMETNTTEEIEGLQVTIGGKNIDLNSVDKDYNSNIFFKYAFKEDNLDDIRYVEIGEKIYIDFGKNPPDNFVVRDHLLNKRGELMYTSNLIKDVPVIGKNKRYYFNVEKNMASALSSQYVPNKKDYRGFTITITQDGTKTIYGFVIQTDAY